MRADSSSSEDDFGGATHGGLLATARAVAESQAALRDARADLSKAHAAREALSHECEELRRREREVGYAALKLEKELASTRMRLAEALDARRSLAERAQATLSAVRQVHASSFERVQAHARTLGSLARALRQLGHEGASAAELTTRAAEAAEAILSALASTETLLPALDSEVVVKNGDDGERGEGRRGQGLRAHAARSLFTELSADTHSAAGGTEPAIGANGAGGSRAGGGCAAIPQRRLSGGERAGEASGEAADGRRARGGGRRMRSSSSASSLPRRQPAHSAPAEGRGTPVLAAARPFSAPRQVRGRGGAAASAAAAAMAAGTPWSVPHGYSVAGNGVPARRLARGSVGSSAPSTALHATGSAAARRRRSPFPHAGPTSSGRQLRRAWVAGGALDEEGEGEEEGARLPWLRARAEAEAEAEAEHEQESAGSRTAAARAHEMRLRWAAADARQRARISALEDRCAALERQSRAEAAARRAAEEAVAAVSGQAVGAERRAAQLGVDLQARDGELGRLRRTVVAQQAELRSSLRALTLASRSPPRALASRFAPPAHAPSPPGHARAAAQQAQQQAQPLAGERRDAGEMSLPAAARREAGRPRSAAARGNGGAGSPWRAALSDSASEDEEDALYDGLPFGRQREQPPRSSRAERGASPRRCAERAGTHSSPSRSAGGSARSPAGGDAEQLKRLRRTEQQIEREVDELAAALETATRRLAGVPLAAPTATWS